MIKADSKVLYWTISSLLIVVFTVLSLLNEGSLRYMCGDDYGPFAVTSKKYNPELYPNDKLLCSMSRTYITHYYTVLYHMSKLSDVKTACLIMQILTRLLFFTSIFLLSISLFSKHEIGWISMMMFVLPKSLYGYTTTISQGLHPQFLAVPLLLVGLSCLFRKQMVVFAMIVSALLYIHAMTAFWGVLIGFFCWLGIGGYKSIRQSGWALVLGAIIAIPFLYQYFHSGASGEELILTRPEMESLARWRISPHVFPLSWDPVDSITKLVAICGILILGYYGVRRIPDYRRLFIYIVVGTLLIWGAGYFLSEIYYLPIINQLQLLRSSSVELIILSTFLGYFVWDGGHEYHARNNYLALLALAIGLLCFSRTGIGSTQILGVVIMGLSAVISHEKINMIIFGMTARWSQGYRKYRWVRKLLVPAVLVILGGAAIYEMGSGMVKYCEKSRTISDSLKEVALWARANTPLDALFVTPPVVRGFRYWAQRSQLPDWKDGGLGTYDASDAVFFLEVMKAYGFHPGMKESYLAQISVEQIISVGHKFGADYAVFQKTERVLPERTVFENNEWQIVRLKSPGS